jgi:hypothetical protein
MLQTVSLLFSLVVVVAALVMWGSWIQRLEKIKKIKIKTGNIYVTYMLLLQTGNIYVTYMLLV